MATIKDVAAYILQEAGPMTAMKLQKLCYFAYGYHLIWEDRQLFLERFEAWANGPVSPDLYREHRGRFNLQPGEIQGNPDALDHGERESIDLVLNGLGEYTAHQLSTLTHQDGPWLKARERDGAQGLDRSNEQLLDSEIADFFDALTAATSRGEEA